MFADNQNCRNTKRIEECANSSFFSASLVHILQIEIIILFREIVLASPNFSSPRLEELSHFLRLSASATLFSLYATSLYCWRAGRYVGHHQIIDKQEWMNEKWFQFNLRLINCSSQQEEVEFGCFRLKNIEFSSCTYLSKKLEIRESFVTIFYFRRKFVLAGICFERSNIVPNIHIEIFSLLASKTTPWDRE